MIRLVKLQPANISINGGVDMKKTIFVLLAVMALVLGNTVPGEARGGHGGGRFGVDLWLGPGWGPWWGPYPYAYPYAYPPSPVIIEKQPDLYIEPQPQEQRYWYFCKDPEGYYPYVKRCPNGWMKVVPSPAPAGPEE
jgi:hypothetical protein